MFPWLGAKPAPYTLNIHLYTEKDTLFLVGFAFEGVFEVVMAMAAFHIGLAALPAAVVPRNKGPSLYVNVAAKSVPVYLERNKAVHRILIHGG